MQTGQYIQDGTVKWIVTDIRDGDMVGDITFRPTLLPGHIKANRAAWADASIEIPRLLAWVQANNMLTTDTTDESKYMYDSENDILTLPNVINRVLQGGNTVESKQAGLPNIEGVARVARVANLLSSGALSTAPIGGTNNSATAYTGDGITLSLDASRSSAIYGNSTTVQPPATVMIPQIKY